MKFVSEYHRVAGLWHTGHPNLMRVVVGKLESRLSGISTLCGPPRHSDLVTARLPEDFFTFYFHCIISCNYYYCSFVIFFTPHNFFEVFDPALMKFLKHFCGFILMAWHIMRNSLEQG